jgi:hypothetical protein
MLFGFLKKKAVGTKSVETMLGEAAAVGIALRPGTAPERLWAEFSRQQIESGGFEMLLVVMGSEQYDRAARVTLDPPSDDVWHFDSEAIEDHGSYKRIAENCCRLTGGDLRFERVTDYVDIENEIAFVEITADGRTDHVDFRINNDWVDPKVFELLQDRLVATGSSRRFAMQGLGQDMLLICKAPEEIKAINRVTGLRFTSTLYI